MTLRLAQPGDLSPSLTPHEKATAILEKIMASMQCNLVFLWEDSKGDVAWQTLSGSWTAGRGLIETAHEMFEGEE